MKVKRRIKKQQVFGTIFVLVFIAFSGMLMNVGMLINVGAEEVNDVEAPIPTMEIRGSILDFDKNTTEWLVTEADTPTGTSYLLFENFGGFWADAEKDPDPGDNLLCWAATASNMLEWTGWGFVGGMEDNDTDEFFQFFRNHVTDDGHFVEDGIDWWFDGTLKDVGGATEDVDHLGFWPGYTPGNYIWYDWSLPDILPNIDNELRSGKAVGISIYGLVSGAHAVTCWGFNYNDSYDPLTNPEDYYLGLWLSDSDSHKNQWNPPDMLRYYAVEYNDTANWWWMPNYGSGWKIKGVASLEVFPGEIRPIADIEVPIGYEGSAISFDASGSSDPDGDTLRYRWDFDGDAIWDTTWSTNPIATHTWNDDYTGTVYLEVFDGRLRDIDTATVTVNNVAPTITVSGATIDENGVATVSGTITDPGTLDTFTLIIDWGEGVPQTYNYSAGTTVFSEIHQYLDDNPTGTSSDIYSISVTVTDDDTGEDMASTTVIVNNVAPIVTIDSIAQPNPQFILPIIHTLDFTANLSDTGTLDTHVAIWDWDDGTTTPGTVIESGGSGTVMGSHIYSTPGVYIVTLTVTDDDGESDTDTFMVEVVDAHGALDDLNDYIQNLPDIMFKNNLNNRKNTLSNKINAIHNMIDIENYNGAIHDLQNGIRGKADGLIDGKVNNDWIIEGTAQAEICMKIDDIIAYLQLFS